MLSWRMIPSQQPGLVNAKRIHLRQQPFWPDAIVVTMVVRVDDQTAALLAENQKMERCLLAQNLSIILLGCRLAVPISTRLRGKSHDRS